MKATGGASAKPAAFGQPGEADEHYHKFEEEETAAPPGGRLSLERGVRNMSGTKQKKNGARRGWKKKEAGITSDATLNVGEPKRSFEGKRERRWMKKVKTPSVAETANKCKGKRSGGKSESLRKERADGVHNKSWKRQMVLQKRINPNALNLPITG